MNIKIAGLWELGWNSPIKEIDLWQYPLRDFGIKNLHMTPITGIDNKFVIEYPTLEDLLDSNKGYTRVFVDERAESSLPEFTHPKKALYIFGKANFSPLINYKRKQDKAIRIDTVENTGLLWPHQVATIILHDRLTKEKKKKSSK